MIVYHPKVWVHVGQKHLLVDEEIAPLIYAVLEAGLELAEGCLINPTDLINPSQEGHSCLVLLTFEEVKDARKFLEIFDGWPTVTEEFFQRVKRWQFHGAVHRFLNCMADRHLVFSLSVCFPQEDTDMIIQQLWEYARREAEWREQEAFE